MKNQYMNNLIGKRITALRLETNMSQKKLAEDLSLIIKGKNPVAVMTISGWERGRRCPSEPYFDALSKVFHVPVNYLKCLTDNRDGSMVSDKFIENVNNTIDQQAKYEIDKSDLKHFHGKPVYIIFKNLAHPNQWGIVNSGKKCLILTDGVISINSQIIDKCLTYEPSILSINNEPPLSLNSILKMERPVWIEIFSTDASMQAQYNGWYHHNENHTCLINALGLTLPYDGLGISYNAFSKAVCR